MPLIETVVLDLPLRDLSSVQQSGTTMEEPVPSNLSCGASQPDAVPDCRPEPAGGASQPADVPCANPNCRFCAHPQPAEKHWAGYCCGACRLRYLNGKGMDHGRRCQQRPQQRAGVGQRAKEQRPRAGAGATQPGVRSGKKRKATTSIPRPADVAQYREHLHTLIDRGGDPGRRAENVQGPRFAEPPG